MKEKNKKAKLVSKADSESGNQTPGSTVLIYSPVLVAVRLPPSET